MKILSNEELIKAAKKAADNFCNTTPFDEITKLETRICLLHLQFPKIMWSALESYSNLSEISLNELLSILCNNYLLDKDREIAFEAAITTLLNPKSI